MKLNSIERFLDPFFKVVYYGISARGVPIHQTNI